MPKTQDDPSPQAIELEDRPWGLGRVLQGCIYLDREEFGRWGAEIFAVQVRN